VCAGSVSSCTSGDGESSDGSLVVERFAWISAGETGLGHNIACGAKQALLVERHEVTRGEWVEYAGGPSALYPTPWPVETSDWPSTGMDLQEAKDYASAQGLRLPTASEWLWIAGGPRGAPYPYGLIPRESAVNTIDVGLGRTVAVGTFASGRTPTGVYDALGNVWEWTSEPIPMARPYDSTLGLPCWVMGGSYLTPARPLHYGGGVWSREVEAGHRAIDIGFRCVVEAEAWLRDNAGRWTAPLLRERFEAVGEEWGRGATPLLLRLSQEPDAPISLTWLLEGTYR
tara:strand:- start:5980 stop:6837 length:858 start_codon:yes stop_codon:yes gene_type:complete